MPAAIWIPVALAAIAVFSIAIRFDLNDYLKERKRLQYVQLASMGESPAAFGWIAAGTKRRAFSAHAAGRDASAPTGGALTGDWRRS